MTLVRPDDWRPQGVDEFEPNAWEALRETRHSVCLTAGAGAGKTEFLAQKAAYLLQTGLCPAPKRILAISFKRDAAQNLALRVQKRCPPLQSRRFNSMTFDAFTKHLLDQFRSAIPAPYAPPRSYRIVFPTRRDFDAFLRRSSSGLNVQQMQTLVARTSLPISEAELSEPRRAVLDAYWTEQYENYEEALLSFPMINRLAEFLVTTNPQVKKALQLTFPFVFIDEFQDTTFAQFGLTKTAFSGSDAIFTVVGDDKQSIMGWADAIPDPFGQFTTEFNAKPFSLVLNWRSHEELVAIQRVIANVIDPATVPVQARGTRTVSGEVSAIWNFEDREQEAGQLAAWIRSEIDAGTIAPHDVAILVRMNANAVEKELQPAFSELDLIIRNLARNVGSIAIQDLLGEEFTSVLFPILRSGASARAPQAWADAQTSLRFLHALSDDDDTGQQRLQLSLQRFTRDLRQFMHNNLPAAESAHELVARALAFVTEDLLRQAFPAYGRDADFQRVREGFKTLLAECTELSDSWSETLDRFEGLGQVSLMTVHKSKGLEFHTMIFFGLDNKTWRSLAPDRPEELNSFFVAFTRAEQRAFFTSCAERGNTIDWIDEVLVPAGVRHFSGTDIV